MKKFNLVLALLISLPFLVNSQHVTTIIDKGADIDDDMAIGKDGAIYGSGFDKGQVYKISKTGVSIFADEGIENPNGLAFDKNGNLLVIDFGGNKIHTINSLGERTVLVDSVERPSGLIGSPFNEDTFYFTQFNKNLVNKLTIKGEIIPFIQGDSINGINGPVGLAFDSLKNLYVANYKDSKIHKVTPDGTISYLATVPGDLYLGFITFVNGFLYGTSFGLDHVYRIDLQGKVDLFAGSIKGSKDGPALEAQFDWPNGIIANKTGDTLYVSDYTKKNIRVITPLDIITNKESSNFDDYEINDFKVIVKQGKRVEVSYSLRKTSSVSISVFNLEGKKLSERINNNQSMGNYSNTVDLGGNTTGIYLIKVSGDKTNFKRKIYLTD